MKNTRPKKTPPGRGFRGKTGLLEQREHVLRQGVGLREHRDTSLLQNLVARQRGSFGGEVSVQNPATRSGDVFRHRLQIGDRRSKTVLDGTEVGARGIDRSQRRVDRLESFIGTIDRGNIQQTDRSTG